jgi:hypothetical protein
MTPDELNKLKIGTRVRALHDLFSELKRVGPAKDAVGSIIDNEGYKRWVRWDDFSPNFHTCNGLCEAGHGWIISANEVELYEEIPVKRFNRYQILKGQV